jgi:6-phosphogluconolactonase
MSASPEPDVTAVVVGGYTAESDGRAVGLRLLAVSSTDGVDPASPEAVREVTTVAVPSPSFVVPHPREPWLFAAGSSDPGAVSAWAVSDDLTLTALGSAAITGEGACHLALSPSAQHLVVASYGSGSVSSFAVLPDGSVGEELHSLRFQGSGPVPERQEAAHAHQVVWDSDEILVCDLGSDCIHRLELDDGGRLVESTPPIPLPAGSGPRHLVVLGDHLVVACELSAEVWLGRRSEAGWTERQVVASSERQTEDPVYPSAIVSDGRRVYVANRGPGTVSVFELDRVADELRRVTEFSCGGDWPRDLTLSRGALWVANQTDDRVSVFSTADTSIGRPLVAFDSPTPSCLVLLPTRSTSTTGVA